VPLFNGRIDAERLGKLARAGLIQPGEADGIFICGPGELIDEAAQALEALGADKARIHFERFTTDGSRARSRRRRRKPPRRASPSRSFSTACRRNSPMTIRRSVLSTRQPAKGIDLPYSCAWRHVRHLPLQGGGGFRRDGRQFRAGAVGNRGGLPGAPDVIDSRLSGAGRQAEKLVLDFDAMC
jgi:hypothetical protein